MEYRYEGNVIEARRNEDNHVVLTVNGKRPVYCHESKVAETQAKLSGDYVVAAYGYEHKIIEAVKAEFMVSTGYYAFKGERTEDAQKIEFAEAGWLLKKHLTY